MAWLQCEATPGAAGAAMACNAVLAELLREYGNVLYAQGASLFAYRHLIVFSQQRFPGLRMLTSNCWDMISRWEVAEPVTHRVPLPEPIFRAMFSIAFLWDWKRFCAVLGIAFLGIARPGEPVREKRSNLVLPSDLLQHDSPVAYLRVEAPKSRRRGVGRVQHISIEDEAFVKFLEIVYHGHPADGRLYPISAGGFRRRWDAILAALGVTTSFKLTPGGLRGGGCVHAFRSGVDLP